MITTSQVLSTPEWLKLIDSSNMPAGGKRSLRLRFYLALLVCDLASLAFGFLVSHAIAGARHLPPENIAWFAAIVPIYLLLGARSYNAPTLERWRGAAWLAVAQLLVASLLTILVAALLGKVSPVSPVSALLAFVSAAALLLLGRSLIGWCSDRVFRGSAFCRMLIIDGVDVPVPRGLKVVTSEPVDSAETRIHPLALDRLARQLQGVDELFVACPPARRANWAMVLKGSSVTSQLLVPELDSIGVIGNMHFAGIASVLVSAGGLPLRERILKRLLDLAIVMPAVILLAPLLILVTMLVKLDSPGPVFFVQTRVGKGNHLFAMYKFRSMRHAAADRNGARSTARDDDRVTRIGRFIRATSIDELPQLLNILKGDMSFVGPRPHAIGSLAGDQLFWEVDQRYHHRHVCKPGLTGLAQVRGFRGATHRREDLLNRLDADLEYVNGWSLMRDVMILFATLKVVVHRNAF